jgi:hypothetical protein
LLIHSCICDLQCLQLPHWQLLVLVLLLMVICISALIPMLLQQGCHPVHKAAVVKSQSQFSQILCDQWQLLSVQAAAAGLVVGGGKEAPPTSLKLLVIPASYYGLKHNTRHTAWPEAQMNRHMPGVWAPPQQYHADTRELALHQPTIQ